MVWSRLRDASLMAHLHQVDIRAVLAWRIGNPRFADGESGFPAITEAPL
jgi:hypothetical protein